MCDLGLIAHLISMGIGCPKTFTAGAHYRNVLVVRIFSLVFLLQGYVKLEDP